MKRLIIIISLVCITTNLFAQQKVKDKGKWSVLNNMEFMDRVRLQPEWYHYWIYYKRVLGIKIPLVGLGLHDSYAKKDMRNILQETPMIAAVAYNKSEAEKYHANVDTVFQQELFKYADKSIDYQYTLTNSRRKDLLSNINDKINEYRANGGESKNIEIIQNQVDRIKANISIIHDSHMSNAKKREAYIAHEKELIEVFSLISRLNSIKQKIAAYE